ncbi:hypothetical protein T439DRAFT_325030 [Meredithblackwellia eburnea MCA 4105]
MLPKPSISTVLTAVVVILVLRLSLHIILKIVLPKNISISSITPFSIGEISFTTPPKNPNDPSSTVNIFVRKVAISWFPARRSSSNKGALVGLHLSGVKVTVSKGFLAFPSSSKPTTPNSTTTESPSVKPTSNTKQPASEADQRSRSKRTTAGGGGAPLALPRLPTSRIWSFFAVSADLNVVIGSDDIAQLSTSLDLHLDCAAKSELVDNGKSSPPVFGPQLVLAVSNLRLAESEILSQIGEREREKKVTSGERLAAVSVEEPLVIKVRPTEGVQVAFGKGDEGVHVRVHELKRILRALEEVRGSPTASPDVDGVEQKRKEEPTPHPLAAFLSSTGAPPLTFSLSLPLFVLSAHYTTPPHVLSMSTKDKPLPHSVAFALTVKDVHTKVKIGGTTEDEFIDECHRSWLGKERHVGFRAEVGWREIAGRIRVDGSQHDILPSSAKAFSLGQSVISLTSTPLVSNPSTMSLAQLHQTFEPPSVILTSRLGLLRGHLTFETFDAALRIFKARPRPRPTPHSPVPPRSGSSTPSSPSSAFSSASSTPTKLLPHFPNLHGSLSFAGFEIRVQAPSFSSGPSFNPYSTSPNPNSSHDPASATPTFTSSPQMGSPSSSTPSHEASQFYRDWSSPDVFCLTWESGGEVIFGGTWEDRSLKRSEAEGRRMRRQERRNMVSAGRRAVSSQAASYRREEMENDVGADEDWDDGATDGGSTLVDELGVPPPPPIPPALSPVRSREEAALKSSLPAVKDVEERPYFYRTEFHAQLDAVTMYILAVTDGAGDDVGMARRGSTAMSTASEDEEATSWIMEEDDEVHHLQRPTTLPSDPIRFDILAFGPVEVVARAHALGTDDGRVDVATRTAQVDVSVEAVGVDLWRPPVMSSLRDFVESFATAKSTESVAKSHTASPSFPSTNDFPREHTHKPLIETLPSEVAFYLSIARMDLRVAGSDPKNDVLACRGVAAHTDAIVLEYLLQKRLHTTGDVTNFPARASLGLREDIRVEANAHIAGVKGEDDGAALVKLTVMGLHVDPVVDARSSKGHTRKSSTMAGHEEEGDDWELKNRAEIVREGGVGGVGGVGAKHHRRRQSIQIVPVRRKEQAAGLVAIPEIDFRVKLVRAPEESVALDEITCTVEANVLSFRLDLFTIYLALVAVATVKSLTPKPRTPPSHLSTEVSSSPDSLKTATKAKRPAPLIHARADVTDLHLFLTLPHNVPLFIHSRRLRVTDSPSSGLVAEADMLLLAGISPTVRGQWDDIFRIRIVTIVVRPDHSEESGAGLPLVVSLAADSMRLRIPFRYVFSQIIDNTANLIKACKQLVHQHVKGGQDWILEPEVEDAKRLPKIDLNVKMLAVEIQDDPFETRLNIIWRAGYEENIARLQRQAAFEAKVEAIQRMEQGVPDETDDDEEGGQDIGGGASSNPSSRKRKVTGKHTIPIAEARYDLAAFDSTHWVRRMRNAIAEQGRREEATTRRLYGARRVGDNKLPIDLLPTSRSAPLVRAMFSDLRFVITKPEYSVPDFLHEAGKGLPRDTQFTLLVPIHFSWKMEQARIQLRDYPLPLVHVPPMPSGGGHDHASWECEADLVIAEEMGRKESIRRVPCAIIPAKGKGHPPLYSITIPRSAMTVKTYATPVVKIRTPFGTRFGWGNSIQPAIQDVTKVLDTLTKATPDPSERIGFWDKLRLQFHWRVRLLFEGEGPVHFHIKGTRDPYSVIGFGAGFVKTWSGNVRILVGFNNPDREFVQIESERYILAIPNLRAYVDAAASGLARDPNENEDRATQHSGTTNDNGGRAFGISESDDYVKICAKFINGVRWGMGAVLERACTIDCPKGTCNGKTAFHRQCRFFDFIPHWEVHTKTEAAIGPNGKVDDSFKGFRSDFIHFSISLTSPLTLNLPSNPRQSIDSEGLPSEGYNSLHFGPQAATHFWAWWRLFDGSMSLPIRQGKLFPSAQPPSKKFGKHCATIKYRFSLAPLFIAHTYRQESEAEWTRGETTMVGLKGKIGRFNVDLHQREQEEVIMKPNSTETKTVLRKAFYRAEVDLDGVDLRVLSGLFKEPEKQAILPEEKDKDDDNDLPSKDEYVLADEDLEWVDLDDFVDAEYLIPDRNPELRVIPFTVCPRFTYYRRTEARNEGPADVDEYGDEYRRPDVGNSKFGNESSHTCLMGCASDTITIQLDSAKRRLEELEKGGTLKPDGSDSSHERSHRIAAVKKIIDRLERLRQVGVRGLDAEQEAMNDPYNSRSQDDEIPKVPVEDGDDGNPHLHEDAWGPWTNRYMVHNPTIQLSNTSRDILLKYYYSQRERRGFMYHLSAKAIKFIRDLGKENARKKRKERERSQFTGPRGKSHQSTMSRNLDPSQTVRLLDDAVRGRFMAPNESHEGGDPDSNPAYRDPFDVEPESSNEHLPDEFDLMSGHLCNLIKPQISLSSDVDDKSTITFTAFRCQLKSYQVIDTRVPDDPVNRQVMNRTFANLDGLQAFYPHSTASKRSDGAFVPLETLVDLAINPWGFERVVPRTSAALRYDKFNQLRMSSKHGADDAFANSGPHDGHHFHSGTDRVFVECSHFSVSANPNHFAAIYNVVTDLLLYSDPLQNLRNKKLEELAFTHDFSNLSTVSHTVADLQKRIRALHETAQLYQVHLDELDDDGRLELFGTRFDLTSLSNELNTFLQALSRAQSFSGASASASKSSAGIHFEARANELVWHMRDKEENHFAKLSVHHVSFSWISKQDSSIANRLIIGDLRALNVCPDQIFAEIIAKHDRISDHELAKIDTFAAILWNSLAPVGGISIIEQFELHLHPVRLQIEHKIGQKFKDYVFENRKGENGKIAESKSSPTLASLSSNGFNKSTESLSLSSRSVHSVPMTNRPRSMLGDSLATTPNRSTVALSSSASSQTDVSSSRLRKVASTDALRSTEVVEEGLDAEEMRNRASLYKTFMLVDFLPTVLYLSYHSEKDDHSRLPDIYNLTYRTPTMQYRSKTYSYLDLLDQLKHDIIRSVWSQKGALIGQLLSSAHRKLPLQEVRSAAKKKAVKSVKSRFFSSKNRSTTTVVSNTSSAGGGSPLKIVTHRPTLDSKNSQLSGDLQADDSDSSSSDSDQEVDDDGVIYDVPHVLENDVPFVKDPDEMSTFAHSDLAGPGVEIPDRPSSAPPAVPPGSGSSKSLPDPHQHLHHLHHHHNKRAVTDELLVGVAPCNTLPEHSHLHHHRESKSSTSAKSSQSSSGGYPITSHPLHPSLSNQSEEAKAKLLLGAAY